MYLPPCYDLQDWNATWIVREGPGGRYFTHGLPFRPIGISGSYALIPAYF